MWCGHVSWYVVLLYAEEVVDGEWVCLVNQKATNYNLQYGGHKRMNKSFCSTWCQKFDNLPNHVDLVITWLTQCADLLLHTEMRVKYYTQIFYIRACRDCWITNLYCGDVKLLQKRSWTGDDKVSFFAVQLEFIDYLPFLNFIHALLQFSDGTCCILCVEA